MDEKIFLFILIFIFMFTIGGIIAIEEDNELEYTVDQSTQIQASYK